MRGEASSSLFRHMTGNIGNRGELVGNPAKFSDENAKRVLAGRDPEMEDAGQYHSVGLHISKWGIELLRTALYDSSLPAIRCNSACSDPYKWFKERGKHGSLWRVGVAVKLLWQATAVATKGEPFKIPERYLNSATDNQTA